MSPAIIGVLATAALFLVVVPIAGAFGVRHRWRTFRSEVVRASQAPPLTYATLHAPEGGTTGSVRVIGALESIQGEEMLWVRGEDLSVAVHMRKSSVYVVSNEGHGSEDATTVRTSWSRMGSLPAGAKVLVCGTLETTTKHPVLRAEAGLPVVALFFDGPARTLVRRSIWSGRQANEYWNSVTPASLAGATLSLLLWAYLLLQQNAARAAAQLAIAFASVPLLPLLPPAVVFFYLYRRLWRAGRRYRALRDVVTLPLRFTPPGEECGELPGGGLYCQREITESEAQELENDSVYRVELPGSVRGDHLRYYGSPDPVRDGPAKYDELAEPFIVDGAPEEIAAICRRRSRFLEVFSTGVLLTGLFVTLLIVLYLLVFML